MVQRMVARSILIDKADGTGRTAVGTKYYLEESVRHRYFMFASDGTWLPFIEDGAAGDVDTSLLFGPLPAIVLQFLPIAPV